MYDRQICFFAIHPVVCHREREDTVLSEIAVCLQCIFLQLLESDFCFDALASSLSHTDVIQHLNMKKLDIERCRENDIMENKYKKCCSCTHTVESPNPVTCYDSLSNLVTICSCSHLSNMLSKIQTKTVQTSPAVYLQLFTTQQNITRLNLGNIKATL